jgi:SAM-dependent methyltransferase
MTASQIDYCKRTWSQKLNFLMGDVEFLTQTIPKGTIDYLVDIESSFFYPDKTAFLKEVREVLKEDGTFYYGTLLPYWKVNNMHNVLNRWFQVEHEEDITANVVRSLKLDTKATSDFVDKQYPMFFRWFLKQSWGIEGTLVHWLI